MTPTNPTPTQQETLLPCPFCGDGLIELRGNEWEEDFRATCIGCLATSSRYRTKAEALVAWNTRAADAGPRGDDLADLIQNYVNEVRERFVGKRDEMNKRTALAFMDELEQLLINHQINRHAPAATASPALAESERFASLCEEQQLALGEDRSFLGKWATMSKREIWNDAVIQCSEVIRAAPAERTAGEQCGYCASPEHFAAAIVLPNTTGRWHRSSGGGHYQCTATSTSDSTRLAAEARNRDKAQGIVLATEVAIGGKFSGLARHELADRITAALNAAAAPADNDAESSGVGFCWVCRSSHRLIASECRAMDGVA